MGSDKLPQASQGAAHYAQVYPRKPRGNCESGMSGLGQDYGGRGSGRDTGDGREAEVDNQAWREELEV